MHRDFSRLRPGIAALAALVTAAPAIGEDDPRRPGYVLQALGVEPELLASDEVLLVSETADAWRFEPASGPSTTRLIFFPGGVVEPTAYVPLVRRVATAGATVFLVKSPPGFAFPAARKSGGIEQAAAIRAHEPTRGNWVVGGHSLGAAIAASCVHDEPDSYQGLVLLGTTHPRDFDLSGWDGVVLKVIATEDRVAPLAKVERNKALLPPSTRWLEIEGGNHAQFGSYGPQAGDGTATIPADEQRARAAKAITELLRLAAEAGDRS